MYDNVKDVYYNDKDVYYNDKDVYYKDMYMIVYRYLRSRGTNYRFELTFDNRTKARLCRCRINNITS